MSLFKNIMYAQAPILKNRQEFYNDYEDLKYISKPEDKDIYEYQLRKLQEFQLQAFKENQKAQKINDFFQFNGSFKKSANEYDRILEKSLGDLYASINNLIASGVMHKETRSKIKENQELQDKILHQLQITGNLLQELRNKTNMTISSSYINKIDNLINTFPNTSNIDDILKNLYHLKGDILEEVGTEWFNKRVPTELKTSTRAYSTGSIHGKNGQLIQDILIMDMESINLEQSIIMDFKLDGKKYSLPLKQFLHMIEKYSGTKQIVIDSEAEDILLKHSLAGIQAKSGINQLPWNKTSLNTHVSIEQGAGDENSIEYVNFLTKIQHLYQYWDTDHRNIKKRTPEYRAMANYTIGTSLSKVLHLSKTGNQFVLTPEGFMPFVDRIIQLYERRGDGKYPFVFDGAIDMLEPPENIISIRRPVILSSK